MSIARYSGFSSRNRVASFFSTRLEQMLDASSRYQMSLFVFHLASILWIAWDPYWLRRVRSRHRAKVFGRGTWIVSGTYPYLRRSG